MQNAIIKKTALAAILATGTMFTSVAQAIEVTGNIGVSRPTIFGVATPKMWRRVCQVVD